MRVVLALLITTVLLCGGYSAAQAAACGCGVKQKHGRCGCSQSCGCEEKCGCGKQDCGCKHECKTCGCDGGYHRMTLEHKQDRERLERVRAAEKADKQRNAAKRRDACAIECGNCGKHDSACKCGSSKGCGSSKCGAAKSCGCKSNCGCKDKSGCNCKTTCKVKCNCKCQGNCECRAGRCCDECAVAKKGERRNAAGTTFLRDGGW